MDYHAESGRIRVDYRRSGMGLVLLLLLAVIYLQRRGHATLLLTALLPAVALAAWYRARIIRTAIDTLIAIGNRAQKVTNPLLFALIYMMAVLPTALFLKIAGKDILRLKRAPPGESYWQATPDGRPRDGYFSRQF